MKKIITKKLTANPNDFYRLVLESINEYSIFTTDKAGNITSWNNGAEEIFGYAKKEVLGKSSSLIFTSRDKESKLPEKELKHAFQKGKMINELYYIRKNGSLFWASGLIFTLQDENGNHTGFTKIVRDLTSKKQFESRKDDFISTATHELRNPLTAIKLYAEIAENQARHLGNAPLIDSVSELNGQIARLGTLMDYLLDVSKIQKNKLVLEKTWFDLDRLVRFIVKPLARTNEGYMFIRKNSLTTKVYADKNRVGQVLTNLILNAIKYSPDGGKIITTTLQNKYGAEFSVQDYGTGISKAEQNKIFSKFFRADIVRRKKIAGVGLGLYIAQKIIKGHGGKIWMKSVKGVGSTFSFNLPAHV